MSSRFIIHQVPLLNQNQAGGPGGDLAAFRGKESLLILTHFPLVDFSQYSRKFQVVLSGEMQQISGTISYLVQDSDLVALVNDAGNNLDNPIMEGSRENYLLQ